MHPALLDHMRWIEFRHLPACGPNGGHQQRAVIVPGVLPTSTAATIGNLNRHTNTSGKLKDTWIIPKSSRESNTTALTSPEVKTRPQEVQFKPATVVACITVWSRQEERGHSNRLHLVVRMQRPRPDGADCGTVLRETPPLLAAVVRVSSYGKGIFQPGDTAALNQKGG